MSRWVQVVLALLVLAVVAGAACGVGFVAGAGLTGGLALGRNGVALIHVVGAIQTGEGGGLLAPEGAFSGRITSQLRRAQRDASVRAVVLRVDSPGGGVTASDEIRNEVLRTRTEHGKPVVVSMGSLAASGGYYVSAPADRILANPTTITGSIGVITVIPNIQGLLEKVGIETDVLTTGPHKDMTSGLRPLSEADRQILQGVIDDSYERFVQVVAEGRGMEAARVQELADGRIFSGRQAQEAGLVDDLGDLPEAITLAGTLAGITGRPRVIEYDRGFRLGLSGASSWLGLAGPGTGLRALTGESLGLVQYLYVVP
ncbi:MAG: signal peptide peptidase SppA [Chloroflexi bacterium]|nr:signal peptide peptidase SppA [Chloroflexota bacterium]